MKAIYWFRRDRRLADNEALSFASDYQLAPVVFTNGIEKLSPNRAHSLVQSIRSLDESLQHKLSISNAEPGDVLVGLAEHYQAQVVIATRAFDTEGMLEQAEVAEKLQENSISLKLVGSYYAIAPGTVLKPDGTAYKVYTPFWRAWSQLSIPKPFAEPKLDLLEPFERNYPELNTPPTIEINAGEDAAKDTLERFAQKVSDYEDTRDLMAISGTSKLSHALAHGEIHPRTIIDRLAFASEVFIKEICWREFYADVMFRNPHTLNDYYDPRFAKMRYDSGEQAEKNLRAWKEGKTGYPIVDAAMRQLSQTGWMHNRARMITASFLIKDLHLEWQTGAEWFEHLLTDFDPSSNAHGWQWTAGCGTDASPYFRVFNPILQGKKFDPQGEYISRYVPELAHLDSRSIHEPWEAIDGYSNGYVQRIVDHSAERQETLARYQELKSN
ncbi:MAG: deoxyribodipyrimidine photo-lyase [Microbacteriaceae bacterium]|nr:deoxyribodipyrimidine photo-lyase [Microbacteriaceae bacterium]